jgi:hypothetical protein
MTEHIDKVEIEALNLFDANCWLGPSTLSVATAPVTVFDLLGEMKRVGIAEALVCHANAAGYSPSLGNQELVRELQTTPSLHPCCVVMPDDTGEMEPPRTLVPNLIAAGVRAVRMLPRLHRFSLSAWSVDELLSELEEHRIPLFLDFGRLHWLEEVVDYDQTVRICSVFRNLPLILVREGIGSTRYIYPILEKFSNFFLELSYYQVAGGIADVCRKFGAHRLLFGSGLTEYAAGPAVAMLRHAEVSVDEKKTIAGDNLRRLLHGVH